MPIPAWVRKPVSPPRPPSRRRRFPRITAARWSAAVSTLALAVSVTVGLYFGVYHGGKPATYVNVSHFGLIETNLHVVLVRFTVTNQSRHDVIVTHAAVQFDIARDNGYEASSQVFTAHLTDESLILNGEGGTAFTPGISRVYELTLDRSELRQAPWKLESVEPRVDTSDGQQWSGGTFKINADPLMHAGTFESPPPP